MPAENSYSQTIRTTCCIAGGGPAGMMLGFLLSRAGVDVQVLEKHADFLRDFRGDTIHPSTFELMYELGVLEDFLRRPHQELTSIAGVIDDTTVTIADFSHLPTHCKFVGLMPQWDFLNFVAEKARAYPEFLLRMESEVTDLILENGRVVGVRAKTKQGPTEIRADLTVGADGRHSTLRRQAGLEVIDLGAPIDVLWMRIPRDKTDPEQTLGRFRAGKILVMLNRGDYWQCAYVIAKGTFDEMKRQGLLAFRKGLLELAPSLGNRTEAVKDWSDISLLSVSVDRLREWSRTGLLCIGDSAHAMSPVGGVGINLAIQDAVAAANALAQALRDRAALDAPCRAIQKRREFPTKMTQAAQLFAHKNFIRPALGHTETVRKLPLALRLLKQFPMLRRIPARLIGLGVRPEHIRTPDAHHHQAASAAHG